MTQPTDWCHVWEVTRSALEALYFLAGIGIFLAACYAAKQVRIASEHLKIASEQLTTAKEIADANRRRESVKLAADQCKYYADQVVPAIDAANKKYGEQHCTFLNPVQAAPGAAPPFVIQNGDFAQVTYDLNRITPQEFANVCGEAVTLMNRLETFAIPFAAGVADEDIGFTETAPTFIISMNLWMPMIYFMRMKQGSRYASVLKLYDLWNPRIAAKVLEPAIKQMEKVIEQSKIRIKPL